MSQLSKINSSVSVYISQDEISGGFDYLYKEYSNWIRVRLVKMTEEEFEKFGKHHEKQYEGSWWAYSQADRRMKVTDKDFTNPDKLVCVSEDDHNSDLERAKAYLEGNDAGFLTECHDVSEDNQDSTALALSGGSDKVYAAFNKAKSMQALVASRKAALDKVLAEKMNALDAMKSAMGVVLTGLQKKVKEVMRVVTMIELYLGIDEELVQIADGERAHTDEPITLRQLQLYMDEELGDDSNGGLDWASIEDFDKWLIEHGGLEVIAPEKKSIVALRPRRHSKRYSEDAFDNWIRNLPNKATYFLIRNGDCAWRITTENLGVQNTLFPKRDEMVKLQETLQSSSSWDKNQAEDIMYDFRRRVFFMQGLVDRTDVFTPILGKPINFMDLDGEERIRFVYDAEPSLSDGKLSWKDFQQKNAATLVRGSRVVLAPAKVIQEHLDTKQRLYTYYSNDYNVPKGPGGGMYELESKPYERSREQYESLYIKYNPGDEIYSNSWGSYEPPHERKNRLSFEIFNDDRFVLNFDEITLEDINYYLNSRFDRPNYLELMPVLKQMKDLKLKEIESENFFITMLEGEGFKREAIESAVNWWKMKTIFKRPINKDDAKAYRMIKKHLSK